MSFTYQQLQDAISAQMNGADDADFMANLPVFIRQSEERIFKSVQLNVFRRNATGSFTVGNKYLSLPADFLAPFSLSAVVDGDHVFLEQKDVSFVQTVNPNPAATGVPRYYAQFDNGFFILAPTPADGYASEIHYFHRPASLTAGALDGTTWLSLNGSDALLYGALFEAAIFQKSEEDTLTLFNSRFTDALGRLKNLGESMQPIDQYRHGQLRMARS